MPTISITKPMNRKYLNKDRFCFHISLPPCSASTTGSFMPLSPYCSFWNRSAAMRRFRASTPTSAVQVGVEVVSSLMS